MNGIFLGRFATVDPERLDRAENADFTKNLTKKMQVIFRIASLHAHELCNYLVCKYF